MAVRFFAVAVASIGLACDVFAAEPPMATAPATMPAAVMTSATPMPMQTVRTGLFGRRTKMVPMTSNMVMPAGYTTAMNGTVVTARADAPVYPQPVPPKAMTTTPGSTPMSTPMTDTAPVVTGTTMPTVSTTPATTQSRPRLFNRLFSRRAY